MTIVEYAIMKKLFSKGGGAQEPYVEEFYSKQGIFTKATLHGYITTRPNMFYSADMLGTVILPNALTQIANSTFYGCVNLKTITMYDNIETIGNLAFSNCQTMKLNSLPKKLKAIGQRAFQNCKEITISEIPEEVTSLDMMIFDQCKAITSMTFGSKLTSIGASTFNGCTSLTTLILKSTTPPIIQSSTFMPGYISKIIVPKGCLNAYKTATNWSVMAAVMEEAAE